jgi:gamma-glutamyltranspeptidase / glutathione hydrolase
MRLTAAMATFLMLAPPLMAQEPILPDAAPGDRYAGPRTATRSAVVARHAMAATSHPLATQVALDVMKSGGNAIDAAVAANAAIGFLEPSGNGIGGDLFALVWSAREGRLYGINASGRSPRGLTLDGVRRELGEAREISTLSPLSVSVPGAVDGWVELHGRFGSLPWQEVLAPAVRLAEEGAPVPEYIAMLWGRAEGRLADQPGFARVFLPGGRAPRKGEVFRNPELASTLRRIAEQGREGFYGGETARAVEAFCRRVGCYLRAEDLARHRSDWVEPVGVDLLGYRVWQIPPPGQGLAVLQMLRLLEDRDLAGMGHNSAAYLHHLIEAKKIVYEDRARFYADPAASPVDPEALLEDGYVEARRRLLDPARARDTVPPGDPRLSRSETIYLAVGDAEGNLVSLIQSNYAGFGTGLVPDGLGFSLQNRAAQFALVEGHANVWEPGKRPFHTIIPGFVTRNGAPYMAFGVMGGDMQPQGHVQVLLNHLLFGMDVQAAGDAARFRHMGSTEPAGPVTPMADGGCVMLETGIGPEVRAALQAMGHRLCAEQRGHYGGYQAVRRDHSGGVWWGASESRVDGQAAGW